MALLTPAWTPFKYHPTQVALWNCKKRFVAVPAGRGSGKTEIAKRMLVLALRQVRKHRSYRHTKYFYCAPTVAQAMDIAWEHFLELIPPQWVERVRVSPTPVIRCRFSTHRADLHIVGLDKPERIEGKQRDGGVVDESSDTLPRAIDLSIMGTLIWRKGFLWRIGVPKRKGVGAAHFRKFFEDARDSKLEDSAAFTWKSSEIMPAEMLTYARTHLAPKDYNEQYNASWETAGGAIFYSFHPQHNVRRCTYDPSEPIFVASDFNVDPMAWIIFQVPKPNLVEVIDELFIRDTNTPATLDVLWGKYGHHEKGFYFFGDPSGRQRHTNASVSDYLHILNDPRFKTAGRAVKYPDAAPPVEDRFASTNAMLMNAAGERRCFVDPGCAHLIRDLEMRTRTTKQDDPDLTHPTDALGYALHELFPIVLQHDTKAGSAVGFQQEVFEHA